MEDTAEESAAVKDGSNSEYGGPAEPSQGWCVLAKLPRD